MPAVRTMMMHMKGAQAEHLQSKHSDQGEYDLPSPPLQETSALASRRLFLKQRVQRRKAGGGCGCITQRAIDLLNSTTLQAVFYLAFVIIFQQLASSVRNPREYYLDKHVMERLLTSQFDASHNTLMSVRRIADIYEWGNQVLWSGLLGDMGPCNPEVGMRDAIVHKGCNDDAWPDGEGHFYMRNATPYAMGELVERMDQVDWTEGIMIRQARAKRADCRTRQLGACYPELAEGSEGDTAAFGYNWTHPTAPLASEHQFVHFDESQLGTNPEGQVGTGSP